MIKNKKTQYIFLIVKVQNTWYNIMEFFES
jgi:hypothetical protein